MLRFIPSCRDFLTLKVPPNRVENEALEKQKQLYICLIVSEYRRIGESMCQEYPKVDSVEMSPQFLELCHYIMMVPMTKKAAADLIHELDLWHLNRFLYHLLHLSFGLRSLENYQQCGRDPAAASWNDEEMTMKPDRNRQKSQPISNWFRGIIVQKPSTMGRS